MALLPLKLIPRMAGEERIGVLGRRNNLQNVTWLQEKEHAWGKFALCVLGLQIVLEKLSVSKDILIWFGFTGASSMAMPSTS